MAKKIALLTLLALTFVWGCGELGKVDQGRVIAFDETKGIVTLIQDKEANPGKPNYNTLPPHVYAIPADPGEMGPEPKVGKRMKLDDQAKEITIFDDKTQAFKKIPIQILDESKAVTKESPLVAGKKFPLVDKEKKTITIYSGRQKLLVTFSVPEEDFSRPPDTWEAGDEVRIYYKEAGKALRFMNISKTDIFKK